MMNTVTLATIWIPCLPNTSETGTPKMMTEIETEAQREGTGMQNKGKWPGGQTGTVPVLPIIGG